MSTDNPRPNPYVGPRAFKTGEKLYGRDREVRELLDLLIAERIVLLHSPSGAGKSSLVQAGLYPRLKEKSFSILPFVRVNNEPPAALKGLDSFNRYTFSVLLSLETALEPEHRTQENDLASISLEEYLKNYKPSNHQDPDGNNSQDEDAFKQGVYSQVLIFDQFEEVLTADSTDYDAKAVFFNQLGLALRDRSRWALFSMREDFLPALDPYLKPIPTRLANTYRLDFLKVEAAHQAIRKPAGECGVDFTSPAVDKLVNDLRQVQVQQADGSMEPRLGPYVEPVQLQVVCFNLWQHLKKDQIKIAEEDISAVGTVDQSLAEYYADQTALVAGLTGVNERLIREWFDHRLITESGIRGQVLKEKGETSGGLSNEAIPQLVDTHLVRAEKRLNADWYELAHDRLIQPVRKNNARWFHNHLSLLQRQATLWEQQNRSDTLYLRDVPLEEAEAWAKANPGDLSPVDDEFLEKCLELRAVEQAAFEAAERERQLKLEAAQQLAEAEKRRAEEQAKSASRLRRRAFILAGVLVLAIVMAVVAFFQYGQAQSASIRAVNNLNIAKTNAAAAQAASTLAFDNAKTAEANAIAARTAENEAADNALIAQTKAAEAVAAQNVAMTQQAIAVTNADIAKRNENVARSRELASLGLTFIKQNTNLSLLLGMEALKRSNTGQALDVLLRGLQRSLTRTSEKYDQPIRPQTADIHALVASPDGKQLVWGGADGLIWSWNLDKKALAWSEPQTERGKIVKALAFHPGGELFATGYDDGQITIRTRSDGRKVRAIDATGLISINSLAYSPDGSKLAFGGKSQGRAPNLFVYDTQQGGWEPFTIQRGEVADVYDLAWSPDGKLIASGGPDRMVHVWDVETRREIRTIKSVLRDKVSTFVFEGPIHSLAFTPNGKWLATGGEDNKNPGKDKTLLIWDTTQWSDDGAGQETFQEPVILTGGARADLTSLAFSPDGGTLATAYENGDILTWNFNSQTLNETIKDHSREVLGLDFSQFEDSLLLVSSGLDRSIVMNNLRQEKSLDEEFTEGKGDPVRLAAGQEDALTIAGTSGGNVIVWDVNPISKEETQLDTGLQNPDGQFYISPDGTYLAYVAGENSVVVQGISSGSPISITVPQAIIQTVNAAGEITEEETPAVVDSLAINQDGRLLAGGMCSSHQVSTDEDGNTIEACLNNEILLWDISTGDLTNQIPTGQSSPILSLAFNPVDPNSIAAGYQDGAIRLWDIDQARMNGLPMVGLGGPVTSLAYHGDGDILASGSANALIALWNLHPPQLIGDPISGADGAVTGLAFNPNTSILYRGTDNGTVTILNIDNWRQLACDFAQRNLTEAEWEQFLPQDAYGATCEGLSLETSTPMPTATLAAGTAASTPTPPGTPATPTPTPTP